MLFYFLLEEQMLPKKGAHALKKRGTCHLDKTARNTDDSIYGCSKGKECGDGKIQPD
jgi:hypothetical protein